MLPIAPCAIESSEYSIERLEWYLSFAARKAVVILAAHQQFLREVY
jgi:hypothetical protein